jgi:uroporphyrin-III C-methyltransferase
MGNRIGSHIGKMIGKVYLVGAGPGDPELLTVKAHGLLRRASVVLHDDLVSPAILAIAGAQAEIINVGKRCGAKGITQAEINTLMIEFSRRGLEVVRLQSGDPAIFGRLAEEMDALEKAQIPFEVVPGITAGLGAAASLRVSLTDRRKSARVVIVTNHQAHGDERHVKTDWKSLAREDATLVIYMPGHDLSTLRTELIGAGLPAAIPAVIVSRATTPDQRHQCTTLENLDKLPRMESPAVLLIGWALGHALQDSNAGSSVTLKETELILSTL